VNKDVRDYEYNIGPFPNDLPQERWHKLWNTIQWCRTKEYFSDKGRVAASQRGHINEVLQPPWYIQNQSGNDKHDTGVEEGSLEANEQEDGPEYYILWQNMPTPEEKTGLSMERSVGLPPFYQFSSFTKFELFVSRAFQLKERNLNIEMLLFSVEDGPQASLERMKIAVFWESLTSYELEGYKMSFFLITAPLKQIERNLR